MFSRKYMLSAGVLAAAVLGSVGGVSAATIFSDNFNRSNNNSLGSPWVELNSDSDDVRVNDNYMRLRGELSGNPNAAGAAGVFSTAGYTNITISFQWRLLDDNTESSDKLYFSYLVTSGPLTQALMQNEGAWTTLPPSGYSDNDTDWHSVVSLSLGAAAANSNIAIMFWTDVSNGDEGFKVDNVVLSGDLRAQGPDPTPIPGAAFLMGSVLAGGAGFGAWRRRRRVAA